MNNLDHVFRAKKKFFGLKYLNSLIRIRDGKVRIRDAGWKKVGSVINIPDPQSVLCVNCEAARN
jgi:hypothetical protein